MTSTDQVTDDGQVIGLDPVIDLLAHLPNRLRMEIRSDSQSASALPVRRKVLAIWAENTNLYATAPTPAAIAQLADTLDDKYDIALPLEDLFFWGGPRSTSGQITAAMDVGPSQIEGVTCEQYALRQEGLDFAGDYPSRLYCGLMRLPPPRLDVRHSD